MILLFPPDAVLLRDVFRRDAHVIPVKRIRQPVVHHTVKRLCVAEPRAGPHRGQQIGRLRHVLRTAREHHVAPPKQYALPPELHRFHSRPANLVHRKRRHFFRHAAVQGDLPRGVLPLARLQHIPEDHLVHLLRLGRRATERSRRRCDAKFDRRSIRKHALHRPNRRPRRTNQQYVTHASSPLHDPRMARRENTPAPSTTIEEPPAVALGTCAMRR